MKKGVVLLITLFFITTISLLILKNLDDTDVFLEKQNYSLNNTQVLIAIKNTKNEVSKLLREHKDDIDEVLENELLQTSIPIKIDDLDIKFGIKKYEKIDINEMRNKDSQVIEEHFISNNVFDYELFKEIYEEKLQIENKKVETSKQVDDIINAFIIKSYSEEILRIKEDLGFLKAENLYELSIEAKYNSAIASAYYILKNDGKVEYFDISFK
ncbi:hypothetical protein [Arcobacter sp. LA11]|uniref:hypothetical protein n=1 Tax=Arcobacter sp. LA11 TaxID=1898176 RepID=UPI000934828D|nr:hypothetical protein [Arcobacter sp. LA11]